MSVVIENERFRKLLRSYPHEALELLYDLYYNSLLTIAKKMIHDQDDAKDIVHDAFLLIWFNQKKLSNLHEKTIEHYLVRIVRNKSVSHFKRRRHEDIDDLIMLKGISNRENSIDENLSESDLRNEMRKVIATFTKREQECILRKIDHEMSLDEIADDLKISRKMVEKSQTNALKKLKKWALAAKRKERKKYFFF